MKLQQFEGGVSSRLAPQLLRINEGVVYENIDNATGVLTPVKDKLATDITLEPYHKFFNAEQTWLDSDVPTNFLEFQGTMYTTDGVGIPQKYRDGVYTNLGIEAPEAPPTLNSTNSADPVEDITVLNKTTTGDLPASDFDYLLFNIKNGVYSNPFKFTVYASTTESTVANGEVIDFNSISRYGRNPITTEEDATPRSVQFKNLEDPIEDRAELYRYYKKEWHLVGTFTSPTSEVIDDVFELNTAVLNESAITSFEGVYQYVYTYYNSTDGSESAPSPLSAELDTESGEIEVLLPSTSSDPQVTHKRLYRIGNNIVQFTLVAELPLSTTLYLDNLSDSEVDGRFLESDNYSQAPAGLNYLAESYAMLFGAIGTSLRFTPIAEPTAWPPEYEIQFDSEITGLGAVSNGVLVFTRFKTFIVTGTGPLSLAQQSLRGDQGCIAFESIQEVKEGMLMWASEDGLCSSSGNNVVSVTKFALGETKLLPTDSVVHDEIYYCHNSDGKTLAWDYRFQPILKWLDLGVTALSVANGEIYGYSDGILNVLYKAADNLTFSYKSPRLVEGSYSEAKTYKKVYIRSEGDIIINIIIDEVVVSTFELTETETHQLQVPQQQQRGYSIQFDITGTGVIHEIEYVASNRKNV